LDAVLALEPEAVALYGVKARFLVNDGRQTEALSAVRAGLDRRADDRGLLEMLARVHIVGADFAGAIEACDRVLSADPQRAETHATRAAALRGLGRPDDALASVERALALRPDDAYILMVGGQILADAGRFDEALTDVDRSLALDPEDSAVLALRGDILSELGRLPEAIAAYDEAYEIDPDPVILEHRERIAADS
jgi:tetratricopeptide (TPR) repeat protein